MSKLMRVKTATKVRLVNKLLWASNIGKIEKLFILLLNCFTKVFFDLFIPCVEQSISQ